MLTRDTNGIWCQPQEEEPRLDGGDSCARTGILSLEIELDKRNMPLFCIGVISEDRWELVRHPYQNHKTKEGKIFNLPQHTSRDNLIQWAVGVDENSPQICRDVCLYYAKKGWVNKDWLDFACRLYLYGRAGVKAPWHIEFLGKQNMKLSMWWNCRAANADEEINQFSCMCMRMGQSYAFELVTRHPNIIRALRLYWEREGYNRPAECGKFIYKNLMVASRGGQLATA